MTSPRAAAAPPPRRPSAAFNVAETAVDQRNAWCARHRDGHHRRAMAGTRRERRARGHSDVALGGRVGGYDRSAGSSRLFLREVPVRVETISADGRSDCVCRDAVVRGDWLHSDAAPALDAVRAGRRGRARLSHPRAGVRVCRSSSSVAARHSAVPALECDTRCPAAALAGGAHRGGVSADYRSGPDDRGVCRAARVRRSGGHLDHLEEVHRPGGTDRGNRLEPGQVRPSVRSGDAAAVL